MTDSVVLPENTTDDPWSSPGTYTRVTSTSGVASAIVVCPRCKRGASLSHDGGHTIAVDGTVSPSLVCPYDGCDWHVYARLEGWKA
jgi:hypothetical protein